MRFAGFIVVLLLGLALQLAPTKALAQVITEGQDSTLVTTTAIPDTTEQNRFFLANLRNLSKPGKAALYSAVLPGLGQAYNKAYWKIPIIYATGAVLGYFLVDNNNKYQDFRQALLIRNDNNASTVDRYADHPSYGTANPNGATNIRNGRDFYRRNRDLTILISIAAWGLNVAEAYVHAHMKDFDVGENLTLQVQPSLYHIPATTTLTPSLTLTLYTKTK
ncbi:DUF5683 domain-containing protein [Pontibacter harenae]|uniref:DUF5683 domain-containing protein n=1 Tax=Pontibacter harenae TaxID=2894083 RepID=UPI001E34CBCE|nr:DUF5683 domain-containing protein [Pontibacter harenae]MCC9167580.1 DUF5683 domain-containing protein [Pontibacter harenae]